MTHLLTILAVENVPRAAEFYRRAFAFKQTVDVSVYAEFEIEVGRRLGLYERNSFGHNTGIVPNTIRPGELSGAELYFHTDDPQIQIRSLLEAGAVPLSPWSVREWGDEAAYFRDPDGHVLVIARPSE